MQNLKLLSTLAAAVCAVLSSSAPASAQNSRSWVSSTGNDANACTRALPCATFAGALAGSKTAISGQIGCVDPGDYGPAALTITQSVIIDCPEGFAAVSSVVVNVPPGTPGDNFTTVHLRGLTIRNLDNATAAIDIVAAQIVVVDRVLITQSGTPGGIADRRNFGRLLVSNSTIENAINTGILALSSGTAVIDNVRVLGSNYGLAVGRLASVSVTRSVFTGNPHGIEGDTGAQVTVDGSTMSGANVGVESNFSVRLSNSDVSFNNFGVQGTAASFGNNRFSGNSNDGTLSAVSEK